MVVSALLGIINSHCKPEECCWHVAVSVKLMPVLQYMNNIPVDVMRSKGVDTVSVHIGVLQTVCAWPAPYGQSAACCVSPGMCISMRQKYLSLPL